MTEQIITMTGLEFTVEGRTVAYGAVIREGSGEGELLGAGARMGSLRPLAGCPTGRMAAALAGGCAVRRQDAKCYRRIGCRLLLSFMPIDKQ